MHHLVSTVHSAGIEQAVSAVATVADGVAEVRFDALWPSPPDPDQGATHLERILAAARVPVLATLRPTRQGGRFEGPENVRLGLLEAAARAGCASIDIECDLSEMGPLLHHLSKATKRIVLSQHFDAPPDHTLGSQYLTAMQDLGASIQKLAFPGGSLPGILRALELAHVHAGRGGTPGIQLLEASPAVRALLPLAGNHATYGSAAGSAPVPGQPALGDVRDVWQHWGLPEEEIHQMVDWPRRWLAVLGDPVDHSLSPRIQNAALRAAGRLERFGALQVPDTPGMLRLVAAVAPRMGLAGASVTSPLKRLVPSLAEPDEIASEVGAANCIAWQDGARCTNTDATAFLRILAGCEGPLLVLGSGASARAALWAARASGLEARVAARDDGKAEALAAEFGASLVRWRERHSDHPSLGGLVQATPDPDAWTWPVPRLTVELEYRSGPGRLEEPPEGRLVGPHAFLVEQGVDAFRYWFGLDADRSAMEAALMGSLAAPQTP